MKKSFAAALAAAFVLSLGIGVGAEEYGAGKTAKEGGKPSVKREQLVEKTVTVQKVDLSKRVVTLKDRNGEVYDIKVSEKARNLSQVKPGDMVNVKYYESVAVDVMKPGEAPMGTTTRSIEERAEPGQQPGGIVGRQVTTTATVAAIDKKKQEVTLKGEEGKSVKVRVQDPANLENVQVGDELKITYTEAMAVSVEKAKK